MKVIVMSDLHGFLPKIDEGFDLMLIPGDVCPVWNHRRSYQWMWLMNDFAEWVNRLNFNNEFSRVVMCAGNHDICLEGITKKKIHELEDATHGRLKYLDDEEYDFTLDEDGTANTCKIYASPICKVFGGWSFMRNNLSKYYEKIPEGLDILITHDAPDINGLGVINDGPYKGTNAGNTVLAKYVKERAPKYAFCGHIHSGNHDFTRYGDTWMANVSIMDENYTPSSEPFVFQYKK